MKIKWILLTTCWTALLGFSLAAQAQTKIMEYNTGITIQPDFQYLGGAFCATPIGVDFLAVSVVRPDMSNSVYILDLKKKALTNKFDSEDATSPVVVQPSATTNSFIVQTYSAETGIIISLYSFNKKNRTWNLVSGSTQSVTTGYASAPSIPVLPGFFINTVDRGGILWLDIYKY